MSAESTSSAPRRARIFPGGRRTIASAWALATFLALAALAGGPGVSRDEAAVVASAGGDGAAAVWTGPPLAPALARGTHALGTRIGLSHLRSYRLGSALAGALLSALVALVAFDLAGAPGGALAPALFWLAPRHLHAGLVATPDLAVAALALATIAAWRRATALAPGPRGARLRNAGLAGAAFGAALLARTDAWTLLPALALHAALVRPIARRAVAGAVHAPPATPGAHAALGAMSLLGPVVLVVSWPGILGAGAGAWLPPARFLVGAAAPLLATPVTFLLAYAAGAAYAGFLIVRALRVRAPAAAISDDVLLVVASVATLAGAPLAHAPVGARPWLPAAAFLAILAARALLAAASLAWPSRSAPLAGALAILVLYPGLRAAVRAHPRGASAWNELAGGAPGAASRGLPRQDGADGAAAVLAALGERARPGARVWWTSVPAAAVAAYARDGRIRPDLRVAAGPEEADVAVVPVEGAGGRDAEYRAWSAFRSARPAAGAYEDEVPIALVYARPGAWR